MIVFDQDTHLGSIRNEGFVVIQKYLPMHPANRTSPVQRLRLPKGARLASAETTSGRERRNRSYSCPPFLFSSTMAVNLQRSYWSINARGHSYVSVIDVLLHSPARKVSFGPESWCVYEGYYGCAFTEMQRMTSMSPKNAEVSNCAWVAASQSH
jgi:hypothetical protein